MIMGGGGEVSVFHASRTVVLVNGTLLLRVEP